MQLTAEARAILQTFSDRGCRAGDVISFFDFGDAIVWENAAIKAGPTRDAFIFLCENELIVEHSSGVGITEAGLAAIC